jgi:ABC-type polysaccharide/polyol phosphate export permease
MFLTIAAIIGASVMIVGALGTIQLARKSKGSGAGALWAFVVVALAIGVLVIVNQTGLTRDASYSTIGLILALAYVGVRFAALKNAKARPSRGERNEKKHP